MAFHCRLGCGLRPFLNHSQHQFMAQFGTSTYNMEQQQRSDSRLSEHFSFGLVVLEPQGFQNRSESRCRGVGQSCRWWVACSRFGFSKLHIPLLSAAAGRHGWSPHGLSPSLLKPGMGHLQPGPRYAREARDDRGARLFVPLTWT